MIIGIGSDLIDVRRIERWSQRIDRARDRRKAVHLGAHQIEFG